MPRGAAVGATTVLVVEDNDKSLKLVCTLLELRGYATLAARTAQEGIRHANQHVPALILMDVQLPDLPGTEALARLRANPRTKAIPVVAVTALAMKGDREQLLALGFDDYLSKPIDVRTFVDSLEPLLDRGSRHVGP